MTTISEPAIADKTMSSIVDRIKREVLSWANVTSGAHRFGGLEFCIGTCEIGHLHGRHQVDIPFSARLRKELVESGKASPHHLYPQSGWISFYIRNEDDAEAAIALLRLNYDRLAKHRCGLPSIEIEHQAISTP